MSLGINNPYKDMPPMAEDKCQELYDEFMKKYKEINIDVC